MSPRDKSRSLSAAFNEPDRRLLAAAVQSHVFERKALSATPVPLGYRVKINRSGYAAALRRTEKALRSAAALVDRLRATLVPSFTLAPLRNAYAKQAIVAPTAIRFQTMRNDFHLLRLDGRIAFPAGLPVRALRFGLELDPNVRATGRRAIAFSVFPKTEGRTSASGSGPT